MKKVTQKHKEAKALPLSIFEEILLEMCPGLLEYLDEKDEFLLQM
jgi:hypothetical protein